MWGSGRVKLLWQVVDLDNCPAVHGKAKSWLKVETGECRRRTFKEFRINSILLFDDDIKL